MGADASRDLADQQHQLRVPTSVGGTDLEHEFIDISVPYGASTPEWPGDTPFECGWTARRESGSAINLAALTFSAHSGTHADAPFHVESAWSTSEALPIDAFIGTAYVVALPDDIDATSEISRALLEPLIAAAERTPPRRISTDASRTAPATLVRLLIRTGHSVEHGAFPDAWPTLSVDAAEWLLDRGVRLIGVDAPSMDTRTSKTLPVHRAIFGAGAYALENLALGRVSPGIYELLAQPLGIIGADAAPVRALLRR